VFNEPEASLYPSLLAPLAQAIVRAAKHTQIWVVTHSEILAGLLRTAEGVSLSDIVLERSEDGASRISGQRLLDQPSWPE
jgi:predicted ATPase